MMLGGSSVVDGPLNSLLVIRKRITYRKGGMHTSHQMANVLTFLNIGSASTKKACLFKGHVLTYVDM